MSEYINDFEEVCQSNSNDTQTRRPATDLELEQQARIAEFEAALAHARKQTAELVEAVEAYGEALHARFKAQANVNEMGIAVIENIVYDNEERTATAMFDLAIKLKEQDDD